MANRVLIPCDWCGKRNARIAKLQRCTFFLYSMILFWRFDSAIVMMTSGLNIWNNSCRNLWGVRQRLGIPGCNFSKYNRQVCVIGVHVCVFSLDLLGTLLPLFIRKLCISQGRYRWRYALTAGSVSVYPRQSGHARGGCLHPWWLWHVPFVPGSAGVLGRGEVKWLTFCLIGVRNH